MRGRNWKIVVPIIIVILVIIGVVVYANRKPTSVDDVTKVTDPPLEQRTEQPSISPETEESEQTASAQKTIEPTVTPTLTMRVYNNISNPPTETPSPNPPTGTPNPWTETEYPPTCEEAGYVIRENTEEGYTVIDEGAPALGHEFGEWKEDADTGMVVTKCTRCGKVIKRKSTYEGGIPRIDFTGSIDGISKTDRVILQFDFSSSTENFSCYSYTTWQGHNTLNFPKKNYTVRLYEDIGISVKHQLIFNKWKLEHKYVLKANYLDPTHARNIVSANIWAEMVASRPNLHNKLEKSSNYGAIDGFPVVVFLNGDFLGLYTMNIHKDDDLFQMNDPYDAIMIANSFMPKETRFQELAAFTDQKNAWEVEFCGSGENDKWAKDSLNDLISFVMNSNDENFHDHLGDYLDIDGAIDYLIFIYVTGLKENSSKDLVLLKYHDCDYWIPSAYDMDLAFGLNENGSSYNQPDLFLPDHQDGIWKSNTDSLLWDRLLSSFIDRIRERYGFLRQKVLTEDAMVSRLTLYFDQIPKEYYKKDLLLYPRNLPAEDPMDQMKEYIHDRLLLLDQILLSNEKGE